MVAVADDSACHMVTYLLIYDAKEWHAVSDRFTLGVGGTGAEAAARCCSFSMHACTHPAYVITPDGKHYSSRVTITPCKLAQQSMQIQ